MLGVILRVLLGEGRNGAYQDQLDRIGRGR
jgi:hypothetical protein